MRPLPETRNDQITSRSTSAAPSTAIRHRFRLGVVVAASWVAALLSPGASFADHDDDLTDALQEGANDTSKKKIIRRHKEDDHDPCHDHCYEYDECVVVVREPEVIVVRERHDDSNEVTWSRKNFSISSVSVNPDGGPLASQRGLGLEFGSFVAPQVRLALGATFLDNEFRRNTLLARGATNGFEVAGDANLRVYLTEEHTTIGLYTFGGLRLGYMGWDYRNEVLAMDQYGQVEQIDDDGVVTFAPYFGVGVALLQTRHLHLGEASLGAGATSITRLAKGSTMTSSTREATHRQA